MDARRALNEELGRARQGHVDAVARMDWMRGPTAPPRFSADGPTGVLVEMPTGTGSNRVTGPTGRPDLPAGAAPTGTEAGPPTGHAGPPQAPPAGRPSPGRWAGARHRAMTWATAFVMLTGHVSAVPPGKAATTSTVTTTATPAPARAGVTVEPTTAPPRAGATPVRDAGPTRPDVAGRGTAGTGPVRATTDAPAGTAPERVTGPALAGTDRTPAPGHAVVQADLPPTVQVGVPPVHPSPPVPLMPSRAVPVFDYRLAWEYMSFRSRLAYSAEQRAVHRMQTATFAGIRPSHVSRARWALMERLTRTEQQKFLPYVVNDQRQPTFVRPVTAFGTTVAPMSVQTWQRIVQQAPRGVRFAKGTSADHPADDVKLGYYGGYGVGWMAGRVRRAWELDRSTVGYESLARRSAAERAELADRHEAAAQRATELERLADRGARQTANLIGRANRPASKGPGRNQEVSRRADVERAQASIAGLREQARHARAAADALARELAAKPVLPRLVVAKGYTQSVRVRRTLLVLNELWRANTDDRTRRTVAQLAGTVVADVGSSPLGVAGLPRLFRAAWTPDRASATEQVRAWGERHGTGWDDGTVTALVTVLRAVPGDTAAHIGSRYRSGPDGVRAATLSRDAATTAVLTVVAAGGAAAAGVPALLVRRAAAAHAQMMSSGVGNRGPPAGHRAMQMTRAWAWAFTTTTGLIWVATVGGLGVSAAVMLTAPLPAIAAMVAFQVRGTLNAVTNLLSSNRWVRTIRTALVVVTFTVNLPLHVFGVLNPASTWEFRAGAAAFLVVDVTALLALVPAMLGTWKQDMVLDGPRAVKVFRAAATAGTWAVALSLVPLVIAVFGPNAALDPIVSMNATVKWLVVATFVGFGGEALYTLWTAARTARNPAHTAPARATTAVSVASALGVGLYGALYQLNSLPVLIGTTASLAVAGVAYRLLHRSGAVPPARDDGTPGGPAADAGTPAPMAGEATPNAPPRSVGRRIGRMTARVLVTAAVTATLVLGLAGDAFGTSGAGNQVSYTVRPGDSLERIAREQDVRGGWTELYAANRRTIGANPDLIRPGTVLRIPGAELRPAPGGPQRPEPPRAETPAEPVSPVAPQPPAPSEPGPAPARGPPWTVVLGAALTGALAVLGAVGRIGFALGRAVAAGRDAVGATAAVVGDAAVVAGAAVGSWLRYSVLPPTALVRLVAPPPVAADGPTRLSRVAESLRRLGGGVLRAGRTVRDGIADLGWRRAVPPGSWRTRVTVAAAVGTVAGTVAALAGSGVVAAAGAVLTVAAITIGARMWTPFGVEHRFYPTFLSYPLVYPVVALPLVLSGMAPAAILWAGLWLLNWQGLTQLVHLKLRKTGDGRLPPLWQRWRTMKFNRAFTGLPVMSPPIGPEWGGVFGAGLKVTAGSLGSFTVLDVTEVGRPLQTTTSDNRSVGAVPFLRYGLQIYLGPVRVELFALHFDVPGNQAVKRFDPPALAGWQRWNPWLQVRNWIGARDLRLLKWTAGLSQTQYGVGVGPREALLPNIAEYRAALTRQTWQRRDPVAGAVSTTEFDMTTQGSATLGRWLAAGPARMVPRRVRTAAAALVRRLVPRDISERHRGYLESRRQRGLVYLDRAIAAQQELTLRHHARIDALFRSGAAYSPLGALRVARLVHGWGRARDALAVNLGRRAAMQEAPGSRLDPVAVTSPTTPRLVAAEELAEGGRRAGPLPVRGGTGRVGFDLGAMAGRTDAGHPDQATNRDAMAGAVRASDGRRFAVLSDELGVSPTADTASARAVAVALEALLATDPRLPVGDAARTAFESARDRLRKRPGMVTLLLAVADPATGRIGVAWTGDTRGYLVHADGRVEQITTDHTFTTLAAPDGTTPHEARIEYVDRWVGQGTRFAPSTVTVTADGPATLLLSTDELHDFYPDRAEHPNRDDLATAAVGDLGAAADRIIDRVQGLGSGNKTVVLVRVGPGTGQDGSRPAPDGPARPAPDGAAPQASQAPARPVSEGRAAPWLRTAAAAVPVALRAVAGRARAALPRAAAAVVVLLGVGAVPAHAGPLAVPVPPDHGPGPPAWLVGGTVAVLLLVSHGRVLLPGLRGAVRGVRTALAVTVRGIGDAVAAAGRLRSGSPATGGAPRLRGAVGLLLRDLRIGIRLSVGAGARLPGAVGDAYWLARSAHRVTHARTGDDAVRAAERHRRLVAAAGIRADGHWRGLLGRAAAGDGATRRATRGAALPGRPGSGLRVLAGAPVLGGIALAGLPVLVGVLSGSLWAGAALGAASAATLRGLVASARRAAVTARVAQRHRTRWLAVPPAVAVAAPGIDPVTVWRLLWGLWLHAPARGPLRAADLAGPAAADVPAWLSALSPARGAGRENELERVLGELAAAGLLVADGAGYRPAELLGVTPMDYTGALLRNPGVVLGSSAPAEWSAMELADLVGAGMRDAARAVAVPRAWQRLPLWLRDGHRLAMLFEPFGTARDTYRAASAELDGLAAGAAPEEIRAARERAERARSAMVAAHTAAQNGALLAGFSAADTARAVDGRRTPAERLRQVRADRAERAALRRAVADAVLARADTWPGGAGREQTERDLTAALDAALDAGVAPALRDGLGWERVLAAGRDAALGEVLAAGKQLGVGRPVWRRGGLVADGPDGLRVRVTAADLREQVAVIDGRVAAGAPAEQVRAEVVAWWGAHLGLARGQAAAGVLDALGVLHVQGDARAAAAVAVADLVLAANGGLDALTGVELTGAGAGVVGEVLASGPVTGELLGRAALHRDLDAVAGEITDAVDGDRPGAVAELTRTFTAMHDELTHRAGVKRDAVRAVATEIDDLVAAARTARERTDRHAAERRRAARAGVVEAGERRARLERAERAYRAAAEKAEDARAALEALGIGLRAVEPTPPQAGDAAARAVAAVRALDVALADTVPRCRPGCPPTRCRGWPGCGPRSRICWPSPVRRCGCPGRISTTW
ncbi:hypothetical protein AFB00_05430 [Pseudonocardia sp. HH130630-07]|nr:hypothetical protein AFB00_05430 [Pseudonocardia sp. HH130630-07]